MASQMEEFPGSFVLALPRTGSTLLRLILDSHPDIYCPDEVNLGALMSHLYLTLEGLHESPASRAAGVHELAAGDPPLADAADRVARLMAIFMTRKGKRRWCDKSPGNLGHLELLAVAFPAARHILLHRHCLDVVQSCLKASAYGFVLPVVEEYVRRDHRQFVPALVRAWVDSTADLLRFERQRGASALRVRYEDLVATPEAELQRVSSFLGVDFAPELLARTFANPHHQRASGGDSAAMFSAGIVDRSIGSGAELRVSALLAAPAELRHRMNELLQELGYPAVTFQDDGFDMGAVRVARPTGAAGPAAPATAVPGAPSVAEVFEKLLPAALEVRPELARVGTALRFVVTGDGGGTWTVDLTREPGRVVAGDGGAAGSEITVSVADLAAILAGTVHPVQPFREGRASLKGAVPLASLQALLTLLAPPSGDSRRPGVDRGDTVP